VSLRLVGAGLPRTGTKSLKLALEQLLGGPCYHMVEVFEHLDHVPVWRGALAGRQPDWDAFLAGYVAAVDWPASAFWRELAEANPDTVVLLSAREDPETWWRSADATILGVVRRDEYPEYEEWLELAHELMRERIGPAWDDPRVARAAYERHNEDVRARVSPDRLVEWRPGDGWEPLCRALDLPIPVDPFPHVNSTVEWEERREAEEAEKAGVE
jgi:hypothetical protein